MPTRDRLAAAPLDGLAEVIARFVPAAIFTGANQRDRVFTPWVSFCAFIGQTLQRDASCREAVVVSEKFSKKTDHGKWFGDEA
jgi:hypothetical protein